MNTNPTLFGSTSSTYDIEQGQASDCFWLSPIGEQASQGRVTGNFLTTTYNSAGIFAV